MAILFFLLYLAFTLLMLYHNARAIFWEIGSAAYLIIATFFIGLPWLFGVLLWGVVVGIVLLVRVESIRDRLAERMYQHAKKAVPRLSKTEEEALNSGDTWLEKDIFVGKPNWKKLKQIDVSLSKEEQSFLDNETEALCEMINEWEISQKMDLSPDVWQFLKDKGFLGLVISKEYGGKGFSARAHSDIVMKISSRSGVAAVTVMVPNSLGPGELLHHYGTPEQKKHYLPRLAKGTDIPCFALTEPGAGSDATSIKSEAIVVEKKVDGKTVLGLNVTLNKRWITLAPVATLIGLAVDLKDPDGLLGEEGKEGITCLLISRDTKNLEIGNRHLPADQPFMNGTIRGKDIFVPINSIIGGQKNAGRGWQMLVDCLSIGRSISLPALSAASSAVSYMMSGAFARIRRQFNVEIGQFEGVQEKLAEIAGVTYLVNATRLLTVAAVNEHKKPSVASAITKYFNTELARIAINDAMDVHAGRAVVVGPRNYLTSMYQGIPISVTVEGANVMSRNLLIFGQGSIACHPYIRDEFYAVSHDDKKAFKKIIWQHIYYHVQNIAKVICSGWTGGLLLKSPGRNFKREYQKLTRLSHAFAWISDLSLIFLGGNLKRKERLSARLADAMSYLYMAMAALKLAQDKDGANPEHVKWACAYSFYHAQKAFLLFFQNFPSRGLGYLMRFIAFPFGQTMQYPSDKLGQKLAVAMQSNNDFRDRLRQYIYLSGKQEEPLDRMECALQAIIEQQGLYDKIKDLRSYKFGPLKTELEKKVKEKSLSKEEMEQILSVEKLRWDAIQVDEFAFDAMNQKTFSSIIDKYPSPLD